MKKKIIPSPAEARQAKEELDTVKYLLKTGSISFDEAKARSSQPLRTINTYMEKRAQDFGVRHHAIHFTGYMR